MIRKWQRPKPPSVWNGICAWTLGALWFGFVVYVYLYGLPTWINRAHARDNGQYADNPLKPWFDSLKSKNGLCCSVADGLRLEDPEWEFNGTSYRVKIKGDWFVVPDSAVISEPNKVGYAMVWPVGSGTSTQIRCFIPGSAT